ncbi:MAG: AAA family ATPase [Betaproteobacteria bacterium]|nr:AAA family ATPase [Betaproteobacteria bacterium]
MFLGPSWADDYHRWAVKVGQALKSFEQAGRGEEARGIWHEFSALSDKYDRDATEKKWETFEPKSITYTSLFYWAQAAGWRNPRSTASTATATASDRETKSYAFPLEDGRLNLSRRLGPRDEVIAGALPAGKVWITGGAGGTFKTALLIVAALCIVTGRPFMGLPVNEPGAVILALGEEDRDEIDRRVTPCNFGGRRPWFECPACDQRCAILYFRARDAAFGCRTCLDLAYTAEALELTYRLLWRQRKLERQLGPGKTRPKGMHRRTYWALVDRIDQIDTRRLVLLRAGLDRLLRG